MDPGSRNSQVTTISFKPLSELIVADLFLRKYEHCFNRIDSDPDDEDGDGDGCLFVIPHLHDEKNRTIINGGPATESYMLGKIIEFIRELTENADEFTKIRLGKFSFAQGVLGFLKIDPRLRYPMPTHGNPEAYDPKRLDEVLEGRRARREEMRARRERVRA
jgi:hypothetical protein